MTSPKKNELDEEDDSSDSSSNFEKEVLTPKQSVINGMIRLGDPKMKRYSLTERETFIFDLENILKILTFKETILYCFPCLDVYATE